MWDVRMWDDEVIGPKATTSSLCSVRCCRRGERRICSRFTAGRGRDEEEEEEEDEEGSTLMAREGVSALPSMGMDTLTGTALPVVEATAATGAATAVPLVTPAARTIFAALAFSRCPPFLFLPAFAFFSLASFLLACRLHAAHEQMPLQPGHTHGTPTSGTSSP